MRRSVPLLLVTSAAGGGLLLRSQVRAAHRRYAATRATVREIDLTVPGVGAIDPGRRPVEVAALGDSGMAGVGVSDPADTLPAQLARRLAQSLGRPVHVVGHGRPGARTSDVLAEQVPRVHRGVDAVVLMVGTNDVVRLTSLPRLARATAALLDALGALGVPVVLSSLPEFRAMTAVPAALRGAVLARAAMARAVQRRIARARPGVTLVDVRAAVGNDFVRDRAMMNGDAFHPSARGYAVIADVLAPPLASAAGPRLAVPRREGA